MNPTRVVTLVIVALAAIGVLAIAITGGSVPLAHGGSKSPPEPALVEPPAAEPQSAPQQSGMSSEEFKAWIEGEPDEDVPAKPAAAAPAPAPAPDPVPAAQDDGSGVEATLPG